MTKPPKLTATEIPCEYWTTADCIKYIIATEAALRELCKTFDDEQTIVAEIKALGLWREIDGERSADHINATEAALMRYSQRLSFRSDGYAQSDIEAMKKEGLWREPE